jgi:hypothetical protein
MRLFDAQARAGHVAMFYACSLLESERKTLAIGRNAASDFKAHFNDAKSDDLTH